MKKALFLLLAAGVLSLAACKKDPDLPDDPHVPLVNPFIGVWNAGGEYWQFKVDGTGGRADTQAGPFPDNFSFFVYAGQDVQTAPSEGNLVTLNNTVTRYEFSIEGNQATLTPAPGELPITLQRVSGDPQALNLANSLIGEWSAQWTSDHGLTWSLKYRADGTVKTFHHEVKHQFENAYALRGNTLVILGAMRFSSAPVIAEISLMENGTWRVQETQSSPAPAEWIYTKVTAAEWL